MKTTPCQTQQPAHFVASRLNQHDRASIASRCLDYGASRWTVARQYGIDKRTVDDICDVAMFERGKRAERIAAKFRPPLDTAYRS